MLIPLQIKLSKRFSAKTNQDHCHLKFFPSLNLFSTKNNGPFKYLQTLPALYEETA